MTAIPALAASRPYALAAAEEIIPSGLRVMAAVRRGAPLVELRLLVPFGGGEPAHPAMAELLAATLLGGAGERDRGALDRELGTIGAVITVAVRPEHVLIAAYVPAEHVGGLLRLLAEVLRGATYPDSDVAAQRSRLVHRLRAHAALPQIIARQRLLRCCYGEHPAACEIPSELDLVQTDAEAVRRLHAERLVPRGSALVLVGDLDPESSIELVTSTLGHWRGPSPVTMLSTPAFLGPREVDVVLDARARQVMVGLAGPAPVVGDPEHPAAHLASLVFGGYFASRLFENLRETLGCVYDCHSNIVQRAGSAMLLIEFSTDPERAGEALEHTHTELTRIAGEQPPGADEIEAARGYAIGSQAVTLSTQGGLADALATIALRRQPLSWPSRWAGLLSTVPDDAVRATAARLFDPAALTGFVHGPAEALTGAPSPLGGPLDFTDPTAQQPHSYAADTRRQP